jgi:hypothetical protein
MGRWRLVIGDLRLSIVDYGLTICSTRPPVILRPPFFGGPKNPRGILVDPKSFNTERTERPHVLCTKI